MLGINITNVEEYNWLDLKVCTDNRINETGFLKGVELEGWGNINPMLKLRGTNKIIG